MKNIIIIAKEIITASSEYTKIKKIVDETIGEDVAKKFDSKGLSAAAIEEALNNKLIRSKILNSILDSVKSRLV